MSDFEPMENVSGRPDRTKGSGITLNRKWLVPILIVDTIVTIAILIWVFDLL